ncbi:Glycoside hydrolase superfamily [Penicillium canescens]|uniref:Glycoside hydrolase superfamily n=1 Tax=Penicillium canescens TaxID=5083 RepID=A0AAD6I006_PENCN|nr:Glycoside hydrolase superfamily [Penicillium canescens]KAJ6023161.1 Glycoside hydrolase superfamily [Penicillium canescens]KAJ6025572.1 Glycoside hydrolase superfamily [Penicillium canescens]KAJ6042453.1 Glycoside hydrolase superfamily [Penicillium canescens]
MVANAIGKSDNSRIVNTPLGENTDSVYAICDGRRLTKLVVVNLRAFAQTTTGTRPHRAYNFHVPARHRSANVERLIGPGSDALVNITFRGIFYDYALRRGMPVPVHALEEVARVRDGVLTVEVPVSSAVLLSLD